MFECLTFKALGEISLPSAEFFSFETPVVSYWVLFMTLMFLRRDYDTAGVTLSISTEAPTKS